MPSSDEWNDMMKEFGELIKFAETQSQKAPVDDDHTLQEMMLRVWEISRRVKALSEESDKLVKENNLTYDDLDDMLARPIEEFPEEERDVISKLHKFRDEADELRHKYKKSLKDKGLKEKPSEGKKGQRERKRKFRRTGGDDWKPV